MARQRELAYQNHIIDSYKNQNGLAKKWATEMQKGNPDLVCSIDGYGAHLAEVKHIPNFQNMRIIKNPMRPKQIQVCREFIKAGSNVVLYVIAGEDTLKSKLYAFDPMQEHIYHEVACASEYERSKKYDIRAILHQYTLMHGWK